MGRPDKKTNTPSPEWAKHLRPTAKRKFAKSVRRVTKRLTLTESNRIRAEVKALQQRWAKVRS
jgi:hypothetical protein